MSNDDAPLPDGWIREYDPGQKHPFWVDTKASPPRAIWVHPYEDEQFLREHPDIRSRLEKERPSNAPPPYSSRRHSFSGSPSGSHLTVPEQTAAAPSRSQPGTPSMAQSQSAPRGFFGKLKDKAIGTKEEREARRREEKRREQLYMQQLAEERRLRQQQRLSAPYMNGGYGGGYGGYGYGGGYGGYSAPYGQPTYAAPVGSPYSRRQRSGFGGGIGLPLLAGAAGGLLLADVLDGPGFGGGFDGGFGGGGFDGGGFDGGGFDGGGFDGGGGW